jgi:LysR family transcriptional regulator, hydrogen peroxide-inducible genes activator
MEMHQIRYFLAVAEVLNFTRAAERCNVAQPSLTRAIKLLEEELGGPLFHRERANTHLSELGKMVRPHLMQVYQQTQTVKQQAINFTHLERSILKLGLMCTVSPTHLIDLVAAVQTRHQGIELQLFDANANTLQERLINGDLEVALYCLAAGQQDERLHYLPLFREQFMIVIHPGHKLASQNAIRVKDLDGERYLNRINCEMNGYAGPIWREHGATCKMVYRSERDDWILAMIAAGLGFGFMPEHSVNHPGVVARPMIDPEFWREVNLVTVRGRPHSPAVGAFVREAMRTQRLGQPALAVRRTAENAKALDDANTLGDGQ